MKKASILVLVLILIFSFILIWYYNQQTQTTTQPTDPNIDNVKLIDFKAQYVRADVEYTPHLPYTEVIRSKAEFDAYIERFAVNTSVESFETVSQRYNDNFFILKQLVVCMIEETSGSIRHDIETVNLVNDKDIVISINRNIPEICTDDMALWHIFVETDTTDTIDETEVIVDGKNLTYPTDINYTHGDIGISLTLKPNWRYATIDEEQKHGVSIWHKNKEDKKIDIYYRDTPLGLCGTGLTTNKMTLGNYAVTTYKYDDLPNYYITKFETTSDGYYIENFSWKDSNRELVEILNTLVLSDIPIKSTKTK